jgi:hypothetical protein
VRSISVRSLSVVFFPVAHAEYTTLIVSKTRRTQNSVKTKKIIIEGKEYGTEYFANGDGRNKEDKKRTVTNKLEQQKTPKNRKKGE